MIGFIDAFFFTITTAHNQWLPKESPIPYWTTSVFYCDWLGSDLRIGHFFYKWLTNEFVQSQSQSYVTTDGQSASLSWNKAPIWGLRLEFYYCQTTPCFLMWGDLFDERTGLSFTMFDVQYIYFLRYIALFSH
jgi:hypothetical protein